ncbi:MAG TPA: ABC transporter ATP-binding protein [Bryobacteraceae bacterium]|nr:ABC transporter ATP-binding protein [Bryobacteraceae bacterium]
MFREMQVVVELQALSKDFPTHRAVDNVSLSVGPGEFFSLVGPSGCGKTTLLRLIGGFETPTRGSVLLDGQPVAHLPPYRRNVSTVFQNYALFPHLTVFKNVSFGLEQRGHLSAAARRTRVEEALSLVQLEGKRNRHPLELSGGERQRVALARSLVVEPKLLLLDEPLSALDPNLRKQMRLELKALQRRSGIAFLFITHDQEEALSLSDRMAVMHAGRIEQIGTPRELYLGPRSRFVAQFLGLVNWVNGSAVRPESLRVSREFPGDQVHSLPGVVEDTTFFGNCVHLKARLSCGQFCTAELPEKHNAFVPGENIHLWWQQSDELPVRRHET